ncbi:glycohydrolase toxin TNT-related protein [Neobacillus niacini]|uniref:TNT domain-containing protein n=1 Tax=Neobacillus niacini TaxID=86668 RepID=UPI003B02E111
MSKIDIKVSNVQSTNSGLKTISADLSDSKNRLSLLRSTIDSKITQQQNIGLRLNQSVTSLQDLESRINALYHFIDDSMDRYVKADHKASTLTFSEKKKSIWDHITDGWDLIADVSKGFVTGMVDAVVATVEGLWNVITHPIETFNGLVYVVQHPVETAKSIWESIKNSWNHDVVNGDAESRSNWFGRAFGEVALAVVGTKGVDKAVKLTKGVKVVEEAGGVRVVDGIEGVLKKTNCSPTELNTYLQKIDKDLAEKYVETGQWPEHIQVPKDPSVLNPDGSINWDEVPKGGYVLDKNGNAVKETHIPDQGEVVDRYGPANGRYTSPVIDGKPYNYDQRSLPYVEDPSKYHQYKITGDFNDIESYVNQTPDPVLREKVTTLMDAYDLTYDDLKIQKGDIAPGFGSTGGGIQYEMPLPVDLLEGLGLIEKIK